MDIFWEELASGLPDKRQFVRILIRLLLALFLGATIGLQRERDAKPAGLRTHMLVALGAALLVLAPLEAGLSSDGVSRIIQGLITGIGFVGGGVILKLPKKRQIKGLTTAASIWMTAAAGVAAGLGRYAMALLSVVFTLIVLTAIGQAEFRFERKGRLPSQNIPP